MSVAAKRALMGMPRGTTTEKSQYCHAPTKVAPNVAKIAVRRQSHGAPSGFIVRCVATSQELSLSVAQKTAASRGCFLHAARTLFDAARTPFAGSAKAATRADVGLSVSEERAEAMDCRFAP